MIRGRLLLLGVSLALVLLLLSNTARGLQSVLVASSTRAPSSGTLGHGLLGSVEFDPINPDVYTSASPPPAAAAVSRALASPPPPPPPPPPSAGAAASTMKSMCTRSAVPCLEEGRVPWRMSVTLHAHVPSMTLHAAGISSCRLSRAATMRKPVLWSGQLRTTLASAAPGSVAPG